MDPYYRQTYLMCSCELYLHSLLMPKHLTHSTELLGLFWTLSIVLYVKVKRPQRFGDWICLRPQVLKKKGKYRVHTGYTDRLERFLMMVYFVQIN
jgi:hypothetical protein